MGGQWLEWEIIVFRPLDRASSYGIFFKGRGKDEPSEHK